MKPNDVSDRAWWFACEWLPDDLNTLDGGTSASDLRCHNRDRLARAFDMATVDLRFYSEAAAGELQLILKDEECDHSVGICWCGTVRTLERFASTLAAYTPMVTYRDRWGEE